MEIPETKTQPNPIMRRWLFWLVLAGLLMVGFLVFNRFNQPRQAAIVSSGAQSGSNHQLSVPIMIDTAGQTINAAEVYLTFDPKLVQVTQVSKDGSLFKLWIANQPTYSNEKGEISFAGGVPTPGFKGKGQIGSVTLQSKQAVTTKLAFRSKTQALLNDGKGTAIDLTLEPIKVVMP